MFCPHTTAGVTINENADPTVRRDVAMTLERLVPADLPFAHLEGNSDAHVKASLMGSSVTVPVEGGRLALGTWQGIYFAEFDGPRRRRAAGAAAGGPAPLAGSRRPAGGACRPSGPAPARGAARAGRVSSLPPPFLSRSWSAEYVLAGRPQPLEPGPGGGVGEPLHAVVVLQQHAQRALEHPGAQVVGGVEAVVDVDQVVGLRHVELHGFAEQRAVAGGHGVERARLDVELGLVGELAGVAAQEVQLDQVGEA